MGKVHDRLGASNRRFMDFAWQKQGARGAILAMESSPPLHLQGSKNTSERFLMSPVCYLSHYLVPKLLLRSLWLLLGSGPRVMCLNKKSSENQ